MQIIEGQKKSKNLCLKFLFEIFAVGKNVFLRRVKSPWDLVQNVSLNEKGPEWSQVVSALRISNIRDV